MGTLICLPGDRASGGPRQDLNPGSLNSEHVSLTLIGENRFVCGLEDRRNISGGCNTTNMEKVTPLWSLLYSSFHTHTYIKNFLFSGTVPLPT